jgi:hypothetical protein
MTTYVKQMQRIVDEYRLGGLPWPTSAKNIANWAIGIVRKRGKVSWYFPTPASTRLEMRRPRHRKT